MTHCNFNTLVKKAKCLFSLALHHHHCYKGFCKNNQQNNRYIILTCCLLRSLTSLWMPWISFSNWKIIWKKEHSQNKVWFQHVERWSVQLLNKRRKFLTTTIWHLIDWKPALVPCNWHLQWELEKTYNSLLLFFIV